jgi:D-ribose pyranose/furanose isomerase RbsD
MTGPANADRALAELAINVAAEKAALDKCLSEEHDTFTVGEMLTHMAHIQDAQNAYTAALEAELARERSQREAATRALEGAQTLTREIVSILKQNGLEIDAYLGLVRSGTETPYANAADDAGVGAEGE